MGRNLVEVRIAQDSLDDLDKAPGVRGVQPRHAASLHSLDASRTLIQAEPVHLGTGLAHAHHGTGTLVGIVDNGFDLNHYAFLDSNGLTRIIRAWDQTNSVTAPPAGFTEGALFSGSAIGTLAYTSTPVHHGTHVTGLAAARTWAPSGGEWWGVADDARIAVVDCGDGCSGLDDGIQYLVQLADSLKMPLAINLSLGSIEGPRNGESYECTFLAGQLGAGKLAVFSAGNAGGQTGHAAHTFTGDTAWLAVQAGTEAQTSGTDTIRTVAYNQVELWGDSSRTFEGWIQFLDTSNQPLTTTPAYLAGRSVLKNIDQTSIVGTDTFWISGDVEIRSGLPGLVLTVSSTRKDLRIRMGFTATTGTLNAWDWADGLQFLAPDSSGCSQCLVPDNDQMISDQATCPEILSVGAVDAANSQATWFTSKGPGLAAMPKPDLSAPGMNVISSLNSSVNDGWPVSGTAGIFSWGPMSGTSMSAPMVTGTLALLLEDNPTLTNDSALTLLKNGSTSFDTAMGWGILDVQALFQKLDPAISTSVRRTAQPADPVLSRRWITTTGRRVEIPAGIQPYSLHPGGIAWLEECRASGCTARGIPRL